MHKVQIENLKRRILSLLWQTPLSHLLPSICTFSFPSPGESRRQICTSEPTHYLAHLCRAYHHQAGALLCDQVTLVFLQRAQSYLYYRSNLRLHLYRDGRRVGGKGEWGGVLWLFCFVFPFLLSCVATNYNSTFSILSQKKCAYAGSYGGLA